MRLSIFMRAHREKILAEWDAFANTLLPSKSMSRAAIRDHSGDMLDAIAVDMAREERRAGDAVEPSAPGPTEASKAAARLHGELRAKSGFDINELAAEYRALRSSVLRLWTADGDSKESDFADAVRFNEAVDQSLADSIAFFTRELERSKNLLLGSLGHDMRNPVNVVVLTADILRRIDAGPGVEKAASRLSISGERLRALLDELVDFNRSALGVGIKICPAPVDMGSVFEEQVSLLRAAHPASQIHFNAFGELRGFWDANRLHQVLGNLVTNAIKYGDAGAPVEVALEGGSGEVRFEVANRGEAIAPELLARIFDPLSQGQGIPASGRPAESLGLGLFICREVVQAHGGEISVASNLGCTVFKVSLPRGSR